MKKLYDNSNTSTIKLIDISRYSKQFIEDIEHVISDMNACCLHLFAFFKAKWKMAQVSFASFYSFFFGYRTQERKKQNTIHFSFSL
jgi:hypothetical protein